MSSEDNSAESKLSSTGDPEVISPRDGGVSGVVNRGIRRTRNYSNSNSTQTRQGETEEDLNSPEERLPEGSNNRRTRSYSRSHEVQTLAGAPEEDIQSLHDILPENSNVSVPSQDIENLAKRHELTPDIKYGSRIFNEVRILSILTFFAILGVLARKGLTVLTTYSGAYLGGVIWANFTACVVMGIMIESQRAWSGYGSKTTIALYIGLSTGFCGSLSSFSSLVLEAFTKSADISIGKYYHYPNGAYGIMECASVVITHMCVSIAGLHLGKHLIKQYDPKIPHLRFVENVLAICGVLAWIAVICLIAVKNWRSWIFSCIVGPIGCWTRFYTSKLLNPKFKRFPLGTFVCNVAATLLLAMLNLLSRGRTASGERIVKTVLSCHMIQGLDDGFCGALSTVSTFVVELYTIKSPNSYKYGFISLATSYICMLLILGSYNWTQGLTDPLCS